MMPQEWGTFATQSFVSCIGLLLVVCWRASNMKCLLSIRHMPLKGYHTIVKLVERRFSAWLYLVDGPNIIQKRFNESNEKPFEVLAPDCRYIFVSSVKHIEELDKAPDTVLSLQAASKQMLQPKYTMHGFNWFDRRGTEGVGFIRALRTLLTSNLPQILPDLGIIIKSRFCELHSGHLVINGKRRSPVYGTITKLVILANSVSFFGKELAMDEEFMGAALAFIEETLLCAEMVRLMPNWIASLAGEIIRTRLKSQKTLFNKLLPVAEQRCVERNLSALGHKFQKHADCIQWIMETSPRQNPWPAKRVVHELMAIWFGSVHALSTTITFTIHDLCLHPEYVEPLRRELDTHYNDFEATAHGLPLLDSFIKESARLTPVESMSTRRCALQSFTLSDGTKLNIGDWACTPVRSIMQRAEHYPDPLNFNGFRFADPKIVDTAIAYSMSQPNPSKLVDLDSSWNVWGTGRMACPGRYYAVAIMKVILGQIIMNYECELVEPNAPRWWTWRSSMLPRDNTMVVFTAH